MAWRWRLQQDENVIFPEYTLLFRERARLPGPFRWINEHYDDGAAAVRTTYYSAKTRARTLQRRHGDTLVKRNWPRQGALAQIYEGTG